MTDWGLARAEGPEQIGLSSARLERLGAVIREDVERGLIPGAVVVIARFGRVGYAGAFGWGDREARAPMTLDPMLHRASMTQAITPGAARGGVEVVRGVPLAALSAEGIAGRWAVADCGLAGSGDRAGRLGERQIDPATGRRPPMPYSEATQERRWHSGGGRLVSSAAD